MKIVIVAFEGYREFDDEEDRGYIRAYEFNQKTVKGKLSHISRRIEFLCEKLKKLHADAMWIIAIRESLITHKGDVFLTVAQKKLFKEAMTALTLKFPQLAIISGVCSKKEYIDNECEKKLKKLQKYYQLNKWVSNLESKHSQSFQYQTHSLTLKELIANQSKNIIVVKNTAYIFQGDQIYSHDKLAPWYETEDYYRATFPNGVYQIASNRTKNHCIELTHPLTQKKFLIGVEICREHYIGTMKASGEDTPLIHFLLSDSLEYIKEHGHGGCLIQLDSYQENHPQLFMLDPLVEQAEIKAYSNDILKPSNKRLNETEVFFSPDYLKSGTSRLFKPVGIAKPVVVSADNEAEEKEEKNRSKRVKLSDQLQAMR